MVNLSGIDILDVIGTDTSLKRTASTNGGEHSGPCPFCGGTDRFNVWPNHPSGRGRWWCRQCERSGDAVDYLREIDGLSFLEACRVLGVDVEDRPAANSQPRYVGNRHIKLGPAKVRPPHEEASAPTWDCQPAERALQVCETALWSKDGEGARKWLKERGLSEETIRLRRLGLNPTKRDLHGLWMWRGIVIPCFLDGRIWYLKVRRNSPGPKYKQVKGGGQFALFGLEKLQGRSTVVICESEFDAMLLSQEAGDLVDVVATGGAGHRPSAPCVASLLGATHWIVALDRDGAGHKGAAWWTEFSARVHRARPLHGNDITDFHLDGGDLRAWVLYHLDQMGVEVGFTRVDSQPVTDSSTVKMRNSSMEQRAEELLARCNNSPDWAHEWAALATEAGWPCFNLTWQAWADAVNASALDQANWQYE